MKPSLTVVELQRCEQQHVTLLGFIASSDMSTSIHCAMLAGWSGREARRRWMLRADVPWSAGHGGHNFVHQQEEEAGG